MSLNEGSLQQDAGSPSNANIPRSKSFTGVTNHKRSASSASAEGCVQESEVGVRTTWGPTLGHCLQSPKLFRHPLSFGGQSKSPKSLRPARALIMFEQISKGLKECLAVTEEDIGNLKRTLQELSNQSQQQLKAAERYMKRLEYQLSKVEELHEQYNIQQKLREGMRNMAYAYVSSTGKERDSALNSVKASYRECAEMMGKIEAQLERMMGTLHFQMKGIQGFARLCSGDVFEITIKHSTQKWKSRGRVLKNGLQSWDSPHATLKALLGEVLFVKAVEVKGLGKSVLLGNKFCETRDLFSAHPQIMTVNLNPSGSLKLNVIITWNPLDGNIDEVMRNHAAPNQMLPPRQLSSVSSKNIEKSESRGFGAGNLHKFLSQDSLSPRSSVLILESNANHSNHVQRSPEISFQESERVPVINHIPCANNSELCIIINSNDVEKRNSLEKLKDSYPLDIIETIQNLSSCLEDVQGQYPELNALELRVAELKLLLGRRRRRGSQSSEFSTSIESVLECFDFLNTETDDDEDIEWLQNKRDDAPKNVDLDLITKTSDSGIGSLSQASFQQEMQQNASPQNKSLINVVENHIDLALVVHLSYCQHLIESLGAFGPLKCKEVYALQKLRNQVPILERFISIFNLSKEERKDLTGVDELKDDISLQELWIHCSEYRHQFCICSSYIYSKLQEICQQYLSDFSTEIILSVSRLIISRILDSNSFKFDAIVTIYQVKTYFHKDVRINLEHLIVTLAKEVQLTTMLQSNDVPTILEAIELLTKQSPSSSCLQSISQLLIDPNDTVEIAVKNFLENVQHSPAYKKIVTIFIEALEANNSSMRQGACLALMILKACETIDELVYISQTDECVGVRSSAKQALMSFGAEGKRAYEQSQLTTLGFHGLGVK